jgi:beta-glucosidase/6-phospho-beta-glucosidase/beta-galactosidase
MAISNPDELRAHRFMFTTGIENSSPVITGHDGRDKRIDEMESCRHYQCWRKDFDLVCEMSIEFLRYGPPYYRTHLGPGRYDWDFADETFARLRQLGINPIADLCHFGVPDWIGNFQNPEWPQLFAEYCGAFARRYPWVKLFTPVNEIYVCATFSAQFGWWNERLRTDRAFVTALKHLCLGNILAEQEIIKAQPEAMFIQSEATQYFHAATPAAEEEADLYNERRFLSLDLCYGHDVRAAMYEFLLDNGFGRETYHWFMREGKKIRPHCVMGNDYYVSNEHLVDKNGSTQAAGEIFGYYEITAQYYQRYHLPVMHTETNLMDDEKAAGWLRKEWSNMLHLRRDGVPILGFTWYSLTDQVDWDTALREDNGRVNPVGLYDLDRKIRPVGEEYKEVIRRWRKILPIESVWVHGRIPDVKEDPVLTKS